MHVHFRVPPFHNSNEEIIKACVDFGWPAPKPVQAGVLPLMTHPSRPCLMVKAFTGSGKTGCFGLGALSTVDPAVAKVQAVILSPTRILADQIHSVVEGLTGATGITVGLCHADTKSEDMAALPTKHIIVATPGKLKNAATSRKAPMDLSSVRLLVLDEADDISSGNSFQDVGVLRSKMPIDAQVVLFGASFATLEDPSHEATMAAIIKTLFSGLTSLKVTLGNPAWDALIHEVDFSPPGTTTGKRKFCKKSEPASRVERLGMFHWPEPSTLTATPLTMVDRVAFLAALLERLPDSRCLIFVESWQEAHQVAALLSEGDTATVQAQLSATFSKTDKSKGAASVPETAQVALANELSMAVVHGHMASAASRTFIQRLRSGAVKVAVATNQVSTGIDLPDVDIVFNLSFPLDGVGGGGRGRGRGRGGGGSAASAPTSMPSIKIFQNRVGRTARNGKFGACVCLLGDSNDVFMYSKLCSYLHFVPTSLAQKHKETGAWLDAADSSKRAAKMLTKYLKGELSFPLTSPDGSPLGMRTGAQPRPALDEQWIAEQGAAQPASTAAAGAASGDIPTPKMPAE